MSLQIRRGTEAERLSITPLTAELIYTTDTQLVYVGDGVTAGGILVGSGGGNGNYGNANVVALLNSGIAGNIIPAVDSLYSLGNSTNQWKDLYVSNNTIYIDNIPLTANGGVLSFANVPLVSQNSAANITTSGNITGGNVILEAGGAIVFPDGSTQTTAAQPYTDSDVATFLASGTDTQNIITTANVSAAFFIGDGGFLSNVGGGGSYGNADVALYLPTYTGNLAGENILLSGTTSLIESAGTIAILPSAGNTVDLGTTRLLGDITPVNAMGGNVGTAALPFFSGQFVNVLGDTITSTGEITGAHLIGEGGNLSNITAANITGQVANSLVSGTVYEGAQPNITSVGTLVDLTTVGNITAEAGGFFIGDGGFLSNINVTSIPAVYFNVTADGNNQTFSNIVLSAYTSNTDITLFYNGALLDSPYYTLSGDTITVNTELQTGDSIDIIRQFASNVVASTYGNSNVYSYLESGSVGNIVPAGNNISSLGSPTNQFKDVWVSNATIYFDGLPLSVDANAEITFNGLPLVASDGNLSITTTGNVDAGNVIANGAITANGNIVANTGYFFLGDGGLLSNIAAGGNYSNANVASYLPTYTGDLSSVGNIGSTGAINAVGEITSFSNVVAAPGGFFIGDGGLLSNISGSGSYSNANVANYLPTYTGNLGNVDSIATTGNITVGTGAFFLGDGGLLSNVASDYGNSNVAAYLPTYTGNLDSVDTITANVISSNATIIANSVTLGTPATPVSVSRWVQLTTASAVPVVLMTIDAADVTHVDFNVVATDATTSSRQVSKLMAINYNSTVDYNEYGSLLIGTTVGDFTVSTDGTDIFLNVIPVDSNSVDYNVVAMIYY